MTELELLSIKIDIERLENMLNKEENPFIRVKILTIIGKLKKKYEMEVLHDV